MPTKTVLVPWPSLLVRCVTVSTRSIRLAYSYEDLEAPMDTCTVCLQLPHVGANDQIPHLCHNDECTHISIQPPKGARDLFPILVT